MRDRLGKSVSQQQGGGSYSSAGVAVLPDFCSHAW
jgi:hypothetical protein